MCGIERVLLGVLGEAERLPETEPGEVRVEAEVVRPLQQRQAFLARVPERDGAEGADVLAETEGAPVLCRHLLVDLAQPPEVGWVRHQDHRHHADLRGVADRRLAHRERLERRRVRLLVGPRDHRDAADDALLVDLAWRPEPPRPLDGRPAADPLLVRERHLVELALVLQQVLVPGLVDDVDVLLVDPLVVLVDRAPVHGRRLHRHVLPEDVDPPLLVAAGEPGVDPALRQVVEVGDLLGGTQRVTRREHQRQRRELDLLRARREIGVEQHRRDRSLVALGVEVVLGGREAVEAGVVGDRAQGADLVDHHLEPLVVPSDRAKSLPLLHRGGDGGQHEQLELHCPALLRAGVVIVAVVVVLSVVMVVTVLVVVTVVVPVVMRGRGRAGGRAAAAGPPRPTAPWSPARDRGAPWPCGRGVTPSRPPSPNRRRAVSPHVGQAIASAIGDAARTSCVAAHASHR